MTLSIFLAVCAMILALSYCCYRTAFYSPKKNRDKLPDIKSSAYDSYRPAMKRIFDQLAARPYETVTVLSREGLTLSAKYYHIADGAPLAIAFHGYRSSGMTDFAGGSELCFEMGQNLLLVDQRAHGSSQGKAITFGIKERQDCLCWIQFARQRFDADMPIFLYGVSMGAATVLMASGMELPDNVRAVIADCPYSSPKDIILSVCRKMHCPPMLAYPFIWLGARLFAGFNLNETTAQQAVKQAKIPILIIHGESDTFVPPAMSQVIHSARPDLIQRITFPNAGHGISFLVDEARYKAQVKAFLRQSTADKRGRA